jgi:hypothetical protein
MSKRKRGRTTKAQASIQSAAAGGPRRRARQAANAKQAREGTGTRFKLGNANCDGRYLVRL